MEVLQVLMTIATNASIRSEAVALGAVMTEETGACGSVDKRYAGKTVSGHHTRKAL
jgi:hypothetical protein